MTEISTLDEHCLSLNITEDQLVASDRAGVCFVPKVSVNPSTA